MCPYHTGSINLEFARDVLRGRHKDPSRFWKIQSYAEGRWRRSRDMRRARQWHLIMTAVERRKPY